MAKNDYFMITLFKEMVGCEACPAKKGSTPETRIFLGQIGYSKPVLPLLGQKVDRNRDVISDSRKNRRRVQVAIHVSGESQGSSSKNPVSPKTFERLVPDS